MKRIIGTLALALVLIAGRAEAGNTYALLVGVGASSDAAIEPRACAEADVKSLYDLVTNKDYLGVPADHVRLLLGKEDDARKARPATKDNIIAAAKEIVGKVTKDDTVIVALVGRGAPLNDRTCFLTAESTLKDRATTALAAVDLENEFKDIKVEKLLVFLDINYKGINSGTEKLLEPNPGDVARAFVGSEDKEEHAYPPGRVIFLANINVAPVIEVDGHGLFTKVVVDGLKGAADTFGGEPDSNITVDELDEYIEKQLPDLARQHGKTREEKQVVPIDIGGKTNHYTITRNPAVVTKVTTRLAKVPSLDLPAEQKTEAETLLAKMPRLKADQDLRKLYEKLADGALTADAFMTARAENYAARKITAEEAREFTDKVMSGMYLVHAGYYKPTDLGELVGAAVKGMYRRLDLKVPADLKDQLDNIKGTSEGKLEKLLIDVRTRLGKREDLEGYKDADLAISQTLLTLDSPYTTYIDKDAIEKARIDFGGHFIGIGIQIRRDLARDGLLVVSPIKGSPAYHAGLLAGDLITDLTTDMDAKGHEMKVMETVSTKGMKTEDAIKRILGKPNTPIKVTVLREGSPEPLKFEIKRNRVDVETVLGARRLADDSWDYMLDPKEKIGYIRLTQFTRKSSADMRTAVEALEKQGARGVVLDLRFNPGGLLDSAVEITDLFISNGMIVRIKPREGEGKKFYGQNSGSHTGFSMACLINGQSASGSEIVAAALQDHGRAVIVGERSFGKGSVQTIHSFRPTEAEIKMTTATFWRQSGKNLNKPSTSGSEAEDWGVRPDKDFEVKLDRKQTFDLVERIRDQEIIARRDQPAKEKTPFTDEQLEVAVKYLKSQFGGTAQQPTKKAG